MKRRLAAITAYLATWFLGSFFQYIIVVIFMIYVAQKEKHNLNIYKDIIYQYPKFTFVYMNDYILCISWIMLGSLIDCWTESRAFVQLDPVRKKVWLTFFAMIISLFTTAKLYRFSFNFIDPVLMLAPVFTLFMYVILFFVGRHLTKSFLSAFVRWF
ncbi:MAG: hypothetical protein KatS3mg017_0139 [Fimbriimonadales bacterium]|nr:MAG: hypothetical protein KatS3mg017_0139 [Fimbriimonadales bacterium]